MKSNQLITFIVTCTTLLSAHIHSAFESTVPEWASKKYFKSVWKWCFVDRENANASQIKHTNDNSTSSKTGQSTIIWYDKTFHWILVFVYSFNSFFSACILWHLHCLSSLVPRLHLMTTFSWCQQTQQMAAQTWRTKESSRDKWSWWKEGMYVCMYAVPQ